MSDPLSVPLPVVELSRSVWRAGSSSQANRPIPEETAIAFSYNHTTYAVMMATPAELEDFAVGFSLAERICDRATDILALEVVAVELGIELRMTVDVAFEQSLRERRRRMAGPSGCGLCGVESLEQAMRVVPPVSADLTIGFQQLVSAMSALRKLQTMNQQTSAVHAAAFWTAGEGIVAVREDVGRHNALDKLAGALARMAISARSGVVLLTSRVSIELVQKAAVMGAPIVAAVSAPTALAIRTAEAAGMTLVGVARADGFEVFTHGARVTA
ncbi:MAG: formate dehydrogenase accessory sulfurtransferase FdhD [Steroidobacteraceae bacterium]